MFLPDIADYHVDTTFDEKSQRWSASVQEIPDVTATGSTQQSAAKAARAAIRKYVQTKLDRQEFFLYPRLESYQSSSLWEISNSSGLSYVAGTIHYPDPRMRELPAPVRSALEESDSVWTETEIDKEKLDKLSQAGRLPEGQTIEDFLDSKALMMLRGTAVSLEWDYDKIKHLSPLVLLMRLTLSGTKKRGLGLDEYFAAEAKRLGKEYRGLELLDEQIAVLSDKSHAELSSILCNYLTEFSVQEAQNGAAIEPVCYAFLKGTFESLTELFLRSVGTIFNISSFYGRNRLMVARMHKAMVDHPGKKFFFSCGVGHCLGPCSVTDLLDLLGWKVRKVD